MASKTKLTELVRSFAATEVAQALKETPELLGHRDARGRNWLHLTASVDLDRHPELDARDSLEIASLLLDLGIDVNAPAFTEGTWQATPLWFAVARGHNLKLATFLLDAGSTPEHCLWGASMADGGEMLELLIARGAPLEAVAEGETPLLGAVKWSRFEKAAVLLAAGANPDYRDAGGMTSLHYMLKKGSDKAHFELFADHGARGDVPGPDGRTAVEIMRRKRDPGFPRLADRLRVS